MWFFTSKCVTPSLSATCPVPTDAGASGPRNSNNRPTIGQGCNIALISSTPKSYSEKLSAGDQVSRVDVHGGLRTLTRRRWNHGAIGPVVKLTDGEFVRPSQEVTVDFEHASRYDQCSVITVPSEREGKRMVEGVHAQRGGGHRAGFRKSRVSTRGSRGRQRGAGLLFGAVAHHVGCSRPRSMYCQVLVPHRRRLPRAWPRICTCSGWASGAELLCWRGSRSSRWHRT